MTRDEAIARLRAVQALVKRLAISEWQRAALATPSSEPSVGPGLTAVQRAYDPYDMSPLPPDRPRDAVQQACDLIANYLWNEDDAGDADFTYLSKIENGHDRPSRDLVVRLDTALAAGGDIVALFDGLPCPRCGRRDAGLRASGGTE